ncbi:Fis family transcriptional regulator [Streptomyces sp. NBC_01476]|uniref:sigma-54-dependent Fis family transcriptional regulator n=1 Tax=Streptomyces sp. NBC_01476 TaxID=2903881 RepID=UPI002E304311|nr:helix-turn-helix domain-containing protein [Streptomyces sp. NBC_01476]
MERRKPPLAPSRLGLDRPVPHLNPVRARNQFMEGGSVSRTEVRSPILDSWQRSRFWGVDADRIEAPYNADFDPHSRLTTAARPVLDRLSDALHDTPMCLILTDSRGRVRDRRTGDRALHRHLDDISLAPGFSYAEEHVGTNGIGTAAEEGCTSHVFGSEHFSERLQRVSCAAAPIRNPASGRVLGLIDLTSWQHSASPLMVALVREAAADIEERLLDIGSERERAALRAFLTSRPSSRRALVTLTDGLLLADAAATEMLSPADHRRLREIAEDLHKHPEQRLLLSDGRTVQVRGEPVAGSARGASPAGYLIELRVIAERREPAARPAPRALRLPGVSGSTPVFRGVVAQLVRNCEQSRWTLVDGEAGTGKLELVRATHRYVNPAGPLAVHDAADARGGTASWLRTVFQDLADDQGTVVLRHLDLLPAPVLGQLDAVLRATAGRSGWVTALLTRDRRTATASGTSPIDPPQGAPDQWRGAAAASAFASLTGRFSAEVTVPPLRHRTADIPALAANLLARHTRDGGETSCTDAALRALSRAPWPGNVRQLEGSLRYAAAHRSGPAIDDTDLPPALLSQAQHPLSAWESTERDMIVQALLDHGGDKSKAARSLGISRATIYRKITAYGIRVGAEKG